MTKNIRNLALATMSGFRHKTVDVPEWEGATVVLREPSAEAWLRWQEIVKAKDNETPLPEKEAIVDNGAHFDGDQSGTVNGVTPPAVQHLTAEVTADSGEYQVLARWDTPKVVKGVSFLLRLTVAADDGSERLVSTARTTETTYRFTQLALGNYRLTVRAVNAWGQQGDPASVSFRIAAPAAPSRIELTPGYFQITATPHLAVYDPTVQFEFWFSEKRIADIRQVETTARYLGTALYWIAASINIKPGH
ncbi:TPA: hypothetical protein IB054_004411, partial [Escherichia coli]|nr:hypothetical protein [Escherichia coli]